LHSSREVDQPDISARKKEKDMLIAIAKRVDRASLNAMDDRDAG
jgi:hypothetical protein